MKVHTSKDLVPDLVEIQDWLKTSNASVAPEVLALTYAYKYLLAERDALVEAIRESEARADDAGDSYITQPIRVVLAQIRKSDRFPAEKPKEPHED